MIGGFLTLFGRSQKGRAKVASRNTRSTGFLIIGAYSGTSAELNLKSPNLNRELMKSRKIRLKLVEYYLCANSAQSKTQTVS